MAFVFKIDGSEKPPIWRKVKVNESITFGDFHLVIQILFGWTNSHLFEFTPKGWGSCPRITLSSDEEYEPDESFSERDTFPYGELYRADENAKAAMLTGLLSRYQAFYGKPYEGELFFDFKLLNDPKSY